MADDVYGLLNKLDVRERANIAAALLERLEGGEARAAARIDFEQRDSVAARALIEAAVRGLREKAALYDTPETAASAGAGAGTGPEGYMTLRREVESFDPVGSAGTGGLNAADAMRLAAFTRRGMETASIEADVEALSAAVARDARRFGGAFERY